MSPDRPSKISLAMLFINRPDKMFASRHLTIAGIDCMVVRKNIRRLNLYVKQPDGRVLVTAPLMYTERQIKSFVQSKADWIRKHQERIREKAAQSKMALKYVTGETLFFWGKPYKLTVIEEAGRRRGKMVVEPEPVFGVSDQDLIKFRRAGAAGSQGKADGEIFIQEGAGAEEYSAVLVMPEGSTFEQREQIVKRKYKELLEKEAERVLEFWSDETGLKYSEWHSRYMKTRWGSLSVKDRRVCLNTRLAEKPEICLIYVALHEVAHVKEANHGPRFKAILDKYMPDWRKAEKILKS